MKILVAAGNGGIGAAMVSVIRRRYPAATVVATWHTTPPVVEDDGIRWEQVDLTDDSRVKVLADSIDSPQWVINTAGLLHRGEQGPEKSIRQLDADFFLHNINTNTLPTLLLAKHFNRRLCSDSVSVFATISARVGSIEDNRLGGWTSYRCSKAALNMALKNISVEWSRTMKQTAVVALHPGTTDTALSRPFQAAVRPEKLFPAEKAAGLLLDVIEQLTPDQSGQFLAYDGSSIPW
jgi:NAD(P)-dependent dehydrogenase (short-subunit alcohol dehydrogenase family)